MRKLIFFLFFLFSTSSSTFSQDPFFKYLQVDKSDQNLRINKLFQDKKGFLWLATSNGLYRFNGLAFKKHLADSVFSEKSVTVVFEDKESRIWVGYNSGDLGILQNDSIVYLSRFSEAISTPVTDIIQHANNTIIISTYGEGIFTINNNTISNISSQQGLSDDFVYVLHYGKDNFVYAGTDRGISKLNLTDTIPEIKILTSANGLPDNIVQEIVSDAKGNLWIGMQDAGVCKYNIETGQFFQSPVLQSWHYGSVTSIVVSHDELWIGTASNGIIDYEFEGDLRFRPFNRSTGHEFNRINDILKSPEGIIFIASGSDLVQSPGEILEFLNSTRNYSFDNVHSVLADKERNIWFSTDEGLFHYVLNRGDNIYIHKYLENTPYSGLHIISLFEDCHGRIWAGSYDHGVVIYDPKTKEIKNLNEKHGIVNSNVLSINGIGCEVWLATLGGVSKISTEDKNKFDIENYDRTRGLANNYIYNVFIDSQRREWFATDGQGITMLDDGKFINYSSENGLKSDVIYSITEDKNGNIWFSTANAGVYKFNGHEFKNYNLSDGIRDLSIAALACDAHNNIVIIHRKGIDLLNADNNTITNLGVEAGILELNPDLNAVTKDSKGNIWIGTQKGLIKYAGHFPKVDQKPLTHINSLYLFLEETEKRNFANNENHISIEFIGLWYANPELVTYQYMLEGYTRDWVSTKDHFITFSNLPPGSYTFHVRSALKSDFSNASYQSLSFKIARPFYSSAWFIILVVIFTGVVSYFILRYREQKVKEKEKIEKEKIEFQFETLKSQVNPHFLFNSFNTLINIIEENKDHAVEYVEKLSVFFRNIVKYRDQELVTLQEELNLVENYLFLQQKRYGKNLQLDILNNLEKNNLCIPPLTLQLLIENAIKHNAISKDKNLLIKIYNLNGYLVVENNVNIKKNVEPSTGFGLQNIVTRYRLLVNKEVKIEHTSQFFKVYLPLISC